MTEKTIQLAPFQTPNYVRGIMPPGLRQEGLREGPIWALKDLEPDVLAQLCDDFRVEIFQKAGKLDPAKPATVGMVDAVSK